MLDEKRATDPRGFAKPNDYAFMHGETFCGACPEGDGSYPHHCLHGTGEQLTCCWCGDCFVDETHHVHGQNFHPLTGRELDITKGIVRGLSNKLIADELEISLHTVKFFVVRICKKLQQTNRAAVAAEAVRRGIVR